MHVKKIKKPIEKTGYPVSGNLRISESGFSNPGYPVSGFKISIRYNPTFKTVQKFLIGSLMGR